MDFLQTETEIVKVLKTIYDPEIPVNIYDLGLIYNIEVDDQQNVEIKMTLTSPNCPMADDLVNEVLTRIKEISGLKKVNINLTFDPPWHKDLMTDEAKLELGFL
jgi:FeS assembly SUF system protein